MFMSKALVEEVMMKNNSQEIYESLCNDNPSIVVMKVYDQIKNDLRFKINKTVKCEIKSEIARLKGNKLFRSKQYGDALKSYNKALLFAPSKTNTMRVAYRNRSLLLFECQQYEETKKDIERCFELGCLDNDVKEKLEKRKLLCDTFILKGSVKDPIMCQEDIRLSCLNIFKMDSEHPEIPGVSKLVNVTTDCVFPRVLAAEDIHPGTIVTIETGFVTTTTTDYNYLSCYFCQKMTLNLIPCHNCCVALFCDEVCRNKCLLEYHEIECNLASEEYSSFMSLVLKAIIKIRNKCADWNEFVQMSDNVGQKEVKMNVYDTFSSNSKLALFIDTYLSDRYGRQFINAWQTAIIINHLTESSFFPNDFQNWQKIVVAAAKLMMYLYSKGKICLKHNVNEISTKSLVSCTTQLGYFSFTQKLKHSCDPNIETISIRNKVILIAIRPIKRGDELTISYVEKKHPQRDIQIYFRNVRHCDCSVCAEKKSCDKMQREPHFTEEQKAIFFRSDLFINDPIQFYRLSCDLLVAFDNLRNTDFYYDKIYCRFKYIIGYNQYCESKNKLLDGNCFGH